MAGRYPAPRRLARAIGRAPRAGSIDTRQLLDPVMNIRLGTRYLRQTLDKFGGVAEYALAAYNAGDSRVTDWQAAGPYHGIDEFVESIPFSETRDYVQAIVRNQDIYRGIDQFAVNGQGTPAPQRAEAGTGASGILPVSDTKKSSVVRPALSH